MSKLNCENRDERLLALKEMKEEIGDVPRRDDVNNHIHTAYSFSPYSPTYAVYMAYMAGLATAGLMDHDSVSGAKEFLSAAKIMNLPVTIGCEGRVRCDGTSLEGRRLNNPDQESVAYVALHSIPHSELESVRSYFKPFVEKRNVRNRKMVDKLNELLDEELQISFDDDVALLSHVHDGGTVTERHILYALSLKLIFEFGKGEKIVDYLQNKLKISINPKLMGYLMDRENPHYAYDVLGILKSELVEKFYIPAKEELPHIKDIVRMAKVHGIIMAYAYLGDVTNSVTGDKKPQKFEDDYLEELFEELSKLGFNAVTYMPSRNTREQLERVRNLCEKYSFFQISGEDINSSRQSFVCEAMQDDYFKPLKDSAWALIGNEIEAKKGLEYTIMSDEMKQKIPDLNERIKYYKDIALKVWR